MERVKLQKIIVVVCLTVLIWVWADLAQDETYRMTQVRVRLADSAVPDLQFSFVHPDGSLSDQFLIDSLDLKGPAKRIEEIRRLDLEGTLNLSFRLSPYEEGIREPQESGALSLLDFIQSNSSTIEKYGLIVERCVPETVSIRATKLEEKTVTVRCINSEGNLIPGAEVEPSTIKMYVPATWQGDALAADVQLNQNERIQAGKKPIAKTHFITVHDRQKSALKSVRVSLPDLESNLKLQTMEEPKFVLVVNPIVHKNFEVRLADSLAPFSSFQYYATDEAKRAYEGVPYHVELVIDQTEPGSYSKALQYRFPSEYIEQGEIRGVAGSLPIIDYTLVPREAGP